jgi:regulator of protease activity HflC (stomatin/prohibitin superfamily)
VTAALIALAVVAVLFILLLTASVRVAREYERGVIFRLGRLKSPPKGPGLFFLIPIIDKMVRVDLRTVTLNVPPQEVITKDNVVVSVDAVVYYEPTDPQRLAYNVANFILAVTKLAQTNLRNLVGDMQLDEALTSRDSINLNLRQILDDATDKWGVRVVRVEIQRIDPPPDVMHAMHEQMKAERTRRALVTQAEGDRTAAITRAEGERQATILGAEANKQQQILAAEGEAQARRAIADAERYRQEAVAAGQANATRLVYEAIHEGNATPDVLAIKYFETLAAIAEGQATKIIVPTEMAAFAGGLASLAEVLNSNGNEPTK